MKYFIYVDEKGVVRWGMTMQALIQKDCETARVTGKFDARDAYPLDEGWLWAVIDTEIFGPRALVAYQDGTEDYRFVAPLKTCALYEVQPQCFRVIHLDVTIGPKGFEPVTKKHVSESAPVPA